ncbi:MAG: hypothetical protein QOE54_3409 [Streptosporangiaceae bacterium]|nr:hypothetical protein [Streptosporangiaceae bacterium]
MAADHFGCDERSVEVGKTTLTTAEPGEYRVDVEARNTAW